MGSPREGAVPAVIRLGIGLALTGLAGPAFAQAQAPPASSASAELLESVARSEDPSWRLEAMRYFTAFFLQDGRGLQSQAGPPGERGREDAWILEPIMSFKVRQNRDLVHELTVPVDIVSAASTDAVDAVSKASEYNEAATLDLTSTYEASDVTQMSVRFGFHYEEPLRSFIAGPAFTFRLFEENTVIGVSATIYADAFDPHSYTGVDRGHAARTSFGFNVNLTQVLSPTTLFDASFGSTEQWGVLETTWNSVPLHREPTEDDPREIARTGEIFPKSRNRNAFFVRLSQHIPASHSTAKASYRFYVDENGTLAHTTEVQFFQYFVPWLYLRAHGRLHQQNAPDFWTPFVEDPVATKLKRSSDSDLEELIAREAGLKLVFVRDQAPRVLRSNDSFDVGYLRYQRTNGLHIDFFSLGYAKSFY